MCNIKWVRKTRLPILSFISSAQTLLPTVITFRNDSRPLILGAITLAVSLSGVLNNHVTQHCRPQRYLMQRPRPHAVARSVRACAVFVLSQARATRPRPRNNSSSGNRPFYSMIECRQLFFLSFFPRVPPRMWSRDPVVPSAEVQGAERRRVDKDSESDLDYRLLREGRKV